MIRLFARTTACLVLMMSLVAAGYAAASARGQTRADGRVLVLCSNGGLVQLALDENGAPSGRIHLCPDLAAGLLAAPALAVPEITRPISAAHRLTAPAASLAAAVIVPPSHARDPPVLA
ncbi:MAG: hypothetical protein R3E44_08060 [Paracoccaceae bacterium]